MAGQGLFALSGLGAGGQGLFALGQQPQTGQQQGGGGSYDSSFNEAAKNTFNATAGLSGPNYSGLQQVNPNGYMDARNAATQNAQNYFNSQLDKQYARSDEDFKQQMANQGIDSGSEAYKRNYDLYNTAKSNAYNTAAYNAYNAGQAEQNQAYNQAMGLHQQQANEANSAANFGLSQAGTMLGSLGQFAGQQNQANLQQGQNNFEGGQNEAQREFLGGVDWSKIPGGQQGAQRALEGTLGTQNSNFIRAILSQIGVPSINPNYGGSV